METEQKSVTRRVLAIMGTAVFLGTIAYLAIVVRSEIALGALIVVGKDIYGMYFQSGKK